MSEHPSTGSHAQTASRRGRVATAGLLFLLALAVYWGGLWLHRGEPFPQSRWPYFAYYARALLDGQLHFSELPPARLDLAAYQGRLYMHQPPFPAVLLAPLVAVFGTGIPDRFVCVVLAALNGVGFYALLGALERRRILSVSPRDRVLLTIFFLFGTAHFYLAMTGNPWELAHIVCNGLLIAAFLLALERRYTLAALVYVAILFTRTHVFLSVPALVGLYWVQEARQGGDTRARLVGLAPLALVWVGGIALLLAFNEARFHDPFENGVSHHAMHEMFRQRFERYGYFHWAYLPRNLYALLLAPPRISLEPPSLSFSPAGLSLFLASPLYVYLFASLRRPRRRLATLLWVAVAPVAVPILLLMGTGELQFGHRYTSDLQGFLIVLTFLGMGERFGRVSIALLAASVAINAWGAAWFVSGFSQ